MRASNREEKLLTLGRLQWRALIRELGKRGGGKSEAGAFLLAERDGDLRIVTRVVYFNDLDPNCLQGSIRFDGLAYSRLSDICEAERRVVVGDIHSHPYASVRQSPTDAENPMIARTGHVAIIVPHLAMRRVRPTETGVHQYLGAAGWLAWTGDGAARRLRLRWWR
jgi:proteasome lid subunit RPN8/RPN11